MALRLLTRQEWEAKLRALGCSPLASKPANDEALETAEWWVTANEKWFSVTCEKDGTMRQDDWQEIAIQVARLRPVDWDT